MTQDIRTLIDADAARSLKRLASLLGWSESEAAEHAIETTEWLENRIAEGSKVLLESRCGDISRVTFHDVEF